MSLVRNSFYLSLFFLLLSLEGFAQVKGTLGLVIDGDSFYMVQDNGRRIRIRLSGIDSPEDDQAYSQEAKAYLISLLEGKEILMTPNGSDKLGRPVAVISVEGKNIAEEMVRSGFAWHYKKYSNDPVLDQLEAEARAEKRGLWKDPAPIAPWIYKKAK
ncbi:thermonuclease family protein [Cesiribacter andamanensis]|uniref:Thermonuclease n=1 Tax=Cesiribacter andamanensis AMV16 TaxID=1279009 RepID=M7N874_9BACT|nr:thermonuclease family protein [Cesiribacter andamanensis]EMR04778.1 Thermonuclease precursor [Cesiribacter andamanensis AMV16]